MSEHINLLPANKKRYLREHRIKSKLRLISILLLVIVSFLSFGTYMYSSLSPLSDLEQEKQQLSATIASQHEKTAWLLHTQLRLAEVSGILKNRLDFPDQIEQILDEASDTVTVESIIMDKEQIELKLRSSSLISLDTFLNNLVDKAGEKIYRTVVLESLSYDKENGAYIVEIVLDLHGE